MERPRENLCSSVLLPCRGAFCVLSAQLSQRLGEARVFAMQAKYTKKVLTLLSASCKILRLIVLHSPVRLVYYKS